MRLLNILSATMLAVLLVACGKDGGTSQSSIPQSSASSSSVVSSLASSSVASSTVSSAVSSTAQVLSTEINNQANKLMRESGATAITIAVAKSGQIEFEQAYGFQDANKTIALKTDALMLTASIVKPVTAAAIRKLESTGLLKLSDHVFCTGSNAPCWLPANLLSVNSDSRAKDITITQLIAHQGGWYRDVSGDPLGQELDARNSLNLSGPPTREDIVRYVMKRPLDFTPGVLDYQHDNYSNFGYLLLGMIIEQAAHTSYIKYVQTEIMAPLGISSSDFKVAKIQLAEHDPREPVYVSSEMCPSVFNIGKEALCSEEGADLNNWVSAGGVITTARAMAIFTQSYKLPKDPTYYFASYGNNIGEPLLSPVSYVGAHNGLGPATSTIVRQLPSGVSYAIFLNVAFDFSQSTLNDFDRISQLEP